MTIAELLDALWRDYIALTPQAARIHQLLTQRGELLSNDHLSIRTLAVPGLGIAALAEPFEALGWRGRDRYVFRDRHLRARYWQHEDPTLPKLFLSELVPGELSPGAQAVLSGLIAQLPAGFCGPGERAAHDVLARAGRRWNVSYAEYRALLGESEYAAWIAAFGLRVHHVAVDFGSLSTFPDLEALCAFLVEHGFGVADTGGAIKGSRAEHLERLSTPPDAITVAFSDGAARIPSSAYEFARRYRLASGELFQGFASATTDPLFAPTDVGISPTG